MGRWSLVVILAITTASTACPAHADEAPPAPEQVTALSPELRQAAGLEREVDLIGMGRHFEIWDRAKHQAQEAAVIEAGMPDAVRDIV